MGFETGTMHQKCGVWDDKSYIRVVCYKLYVADWENSHNIDLKEKYTSIKNYYKYLREHNLGDAYYSYENYILDFGYNGEVYVNFPTFCAGGFLYLNSEYICQLLGDDDLVKLYKEDINQIKKELLRMHDIEC